MYCSEDVVRTCRNETVDFLRLVYVGNDGVLRGKVANAKNVETLLEAGLNVPETTQSFTSLDHVVADGRFADGGEARLIPDPTTFRLLPYAERTAIMVCDMRAVDGGEWAADPRSRLRQFLDASVPEKQTFRLSFESEFSLVRETDAGFEPVDRSLGYSVNSMQETHGFLTELVDVLGTLGMTFESYVPEYGHGQQEVVVKHAPDLRAADNHVLFRQAVRSVATNHGSIATFLPKPDEKAGNGCHVHLSLWEDGENLFYDRSSDSRFNLSETAEHFVGGILEHSNSLAALTTPTVMSYDRLVPGKWASAYACWGRDNREAAVRIPSHQQGKAAATTRLEFKPADNTMNPYLGQLGLIAAGMDGVKNELTPPEPVSDAPHSLFEREAKADRISRLPTSLRSALEALEDDDVLVNALGEDLTESYLEVKYAECDLVESDPHERDLESLLRAF